MEVEVSVKRNRHRLFYGWLVVGAAFAIAASEGALRGSLLAMFIVPMSETFGSSRTALVGAASVGVMLGALVAPLVGPIIDRRGPRGLVATGVAVAGTCLVGLAFVRELWHYWVLYIIARGLSSSMISMGATVAVANWFVQRRGRAVAISSLGSRISIPLLIIMSQALISLYSWRAAWFAIGVTTTLIALPPTLLFLRRRPEDMGLLPDGDLPHQTVGHGSPSRRTRPVQEISWSLGEAVRTRTLWLVVLTLSLGFLAAEAVNFHAFASFTDRGISTANAAAVVTVTVLVQGVASLVWGFAAERVPGRYALAVAFMSGAVGMVAIMQANTLPWAYAYGLFYGISFGGTRILGQVLFADYFGRLHLGAIRGFIQPFNTAAMAVGPVMASLLYDLRGSYFIAFVVFLAAYILAAGVILLAPPPKKQPALQQA